MLLPEPSTEDDADAVSSKLRHALSTPIIASDLKLQVGVSIGLATIGSAASSTEALAIADAAMYHDKTARRR